MVPAPYNVVYVSAGHWYFGEMGYEPINRNKQIKVLIIEDAPEIVEAISIVIEMRWPESKVIYTTMGKQGIDLAGRVSPSVIILDLGLPDISGFDVLKRIRLFSNIPILILTVKADELSIATGLKWGADDYIVKPFKQLELLSRIQKALRRYAA